MRSFSPLASTILLAGLAQSAQRDTDVGAGLMIGGAGVWLVDEIMLMR
jgi:hypothetical protein